MSTDWQYLNLNYIAKAHIDQDALHQMRPLSHRLRGHLAPGHHRVRRRTVRHFEVLEDECVGCNLCVNVCPVENCITMDALPAGATDRRTGKPVDPDYANWTTHPNNPMAKPAVEPAE
jgi:dihydropyrimidine dehydrogenase (NAD+) subunit PreA